MASRRVPEVEARVTRPSFQFYPGDWRKNANLRRCSPAARGVWVDILCALHDSDTYGILRWPLQDIANAAGASMTHVRELVAKDVLKGCDKGDCQPLVYRPRSGRKEGPPVTLLEPEAGPIWFSSRMVKDEYVRQNAGKATRFAGQDDDGDHTPPGLNGRHGDPPSRSPSRRDGEGGDTSPSHSPSRGQGDGSSSSSSTSVGIPIHDQLSLVSARPSADPPPLVLVGSPSPKPTTPPDCPHQAVLALWAEVLPHLPQHDPEQWRGTRADHLRARWRETGVAKGWTQQQQGLAYLRKLFAFVGQSAFLTGREHDPGKRPFQIELAWLVNPTNWAKVIEGKYHPTTEEETA